MIVYSKKNIYDGIIKRILIPQEYDEEELKEDYEVSNLWYKVEVNGNEIDVIVPRNKKYANFYVKDKVKLIKIITTYTKDEYEQRLLEQINCYCSYLRYEQRKEKYEQLKKERNDYCIVSYDIIKE